MVTDDIVFNSDYNDIISDKISSIKNNYNIDKISSIKNNYNNAIIDKIIKNNNNPKEKSELKTTWAYDAAKDLASHHNIGDTALFESILEEQMMKKQTILEEQIKKEMKEQMALPEPSNWATPLEISQMKEDEQSPFPPSPFSSSPFPPSPFPPSSPKPQKVRKVVKVRKVLRPAAGIGRQLEID